jgi:release factor glutamine methyltransferase
VRRLKEASQEQTTMYDCFLTAYHAFQAAEVEDPLLETLHLMDLLSNGAFRRLDWRFLSRAKVNLGEVVQERRTGKPLEYTLGRSTFMGLTLYSSPAALIPRKETELLVEVVLDKIHAREKLARPVRVIDVGTGSGNIAVSLAVYSQHTEVLAIDISEEAIELAAKNVYRFGLHDRISLFCGDLFQPMAGKGYENQIDAVVCNPPYIPTMSLDKLSRDILDHEPRVALDAGAYGIDLLRRLVCEAVPYLKPGGMLAFEIGAGQERVARWLVESSEQYEDVRSVAGEAGQARVIRASRK